MTKRQKKKAFSKYGPNAFAGWAEYRHGSRSVAYAPGKNPVVKSVIKGQRREHVVSKVLDQLKDWRSSPFEHEASTRAGLRSGLCLNGFGWDVSDLVAEDVVTDALRQMDAQRPTFEQGQPEFVDALHACAWCARPLDEEQMSGNRAYRYCSVECAKAARLRDDLRERPKNDKTKRSAEAIIYRATLKPRTCLECAGEFRPQSPGKDQRFCSIACGAAYRSRLQSVVRIPKACEFCGVGYLAGNYKSHHCSDACFKTANRMRKGHVPKLLKPHVFDHFITVPVNAAPRLLTSNAFDWLLLEQGLRITGQVRVSV